jgi:putative hemolysin
MPSLSRSPKPTRRGASRSGRPPAGVRKGERVKDYPQTSLRLPPEIKAKLYALSRVAGTPQWRVVSEAVECFLRERSRADQRRVIRYMGERRRR